MSSNTKHIAQAAAPAMAGAPQLRSRLLQRKCACGSHTPAGAPCKTCGEQTKPALQARLQVGAVDDPLEAEADRVSEQVLAAPPHQHGGPGKAAHAAPRIQRFSQRPAAAGSDVVPGSVEQVLSGAGRALDAPLRRDMEQRFGRDFSGVRVHADGAAARSAQDIHARAYTAGKQLVFGAGQFAPSTTEGRRLLAHELTHVVQQSAAGLAGGAGRLLQRAPLKIVGADVSAALQPEERRAAASCAIDCDGASIGTLHAMPLFFHASRGPVLPDATGADGIGAALHFIRGSGAIPAGNACSTCTDYKIIQILKTNQTSDARAKESYVDNAGGATPFYGDFGKSGKGEHAIPAKYADAGEKVRSTQSIYDTPFRAAAKLTALGAKNLTWNAESCVACIKPGKDKLLGCTSYGFKRDWDATRSAHGPVQPVSPACLARPSAHFVATLKADTTTSSYDFEV